MDLPRSAINRLRIRAAGTERSSAIAAVSKQLAATDLTPSGLPPSAILLVRSLADPLPGMIDISRPHDARYARWQRRVRERIEELARHASRPERGRVQLTADAILFADDAELLACLALDIALSGDAHAWWRQAVARYAARNSVYPLLRAQMAQVPAVLSLLATWRKLEEVAARIEPREALALAGALAAHFELHTLAGVIGQAGGAGEATEFGEPATAGGVSPATLGGQPGLAVASPVAVDKPGRVTDNGPFDRWLTTTASGLDRSRRLLMGLAIAIRHPAFPLRTGEFAREVARWLTTDTALERPGAAPAHDRHQRPGRPIGGVASDFPAGGATPSLRSSEVREFGAPTPPPSAADAADAPVLTESASADEAMNSADGNAWDSAGELTSLGGLLFLINVMEHLGLPDCFEEQCRLASSTGAVGTLEALARVLAGTRGEELAHDPVWATLAALEGRGAHEPPRADGMRPPDKLPAAWLEQLGDETLVPRVPDLQAIEAMRRAGWPAALLHWLELVMPFIGWRIARACALDDVGEAVRLLIELPARIYVTASHLDVVTSIENIRVPVRLAGLDRSPGWVRSLQRVVLFHFE